jgi:hypothetical protein
MPFFLRRVVRLGRLRRIPLDSGFALFSLQAIDLIPQALDLDLCVSQVRRQFLHQVQQPQDQLAGIFILDAAQVNVVKHSAVSLPDHSLFGNRPIYPAFSPTF